MASTTFVIVAKGEAASLATLHCSPVFFQIATVQEVNSTMFASGLVVKHCVGIDSFYPLFVSLQMRLSFYALIQLVLVFMSLSPNQLHLNNYASLNSMYMAVFII